MKKLKSPNENIAEARIKQLREAAALIRSSYIDGELSANQVADHIAKETHNAYEAAYLALKIATPLVDCQELELRKGLVKRVAEQFTKE